MTSQSPLTTQVVHLDFIALSETATPEAVEDLIHEAAGLTQLPSVRLAGVIRTEKATPEALTGRHQRLVDSTDEPSQAPLSLLGPPAGERSDRGAGGEGIPAEEQSPRAEPRHSGPGVMLSSGVPPAPTSDFDLAFFFVLDGFTSLEPFGTDPLYIRFLQGKVARILRAFAGADIALDAPFPDVASYATCLALMAPEQTYDWEVRTALETWAHQQHRAQPGRSGPGGTTQPGGSGSVSTTQLGRSGPGAESQPSLSREGAQSAIGLAIGERQRYRGCVLSFTTTEPAPERLADRRFESTLIAGRATRL